LQHFSGDQGGYVGLWRVTIDLLSQRDRTSVQQTCMANIGSPVSSMCFCAQSTKLAIVTKMKRCGMSKQPWVSTNTFAGKNKEQVQKLALYRISGHGMLIAESFSFTRAI
jgi:hypothetical protein